MAEVKALRESLTEGKVAPEFSCPTPDGSKNLGPQDFKGKFWYWISGRPGVVLAGLKFRI